MAEIGKVAETELVLDLSDKDAGEKKHSGRYVSIEGQNDPLLANAYLSRTFVGPKGQTAKRVKIVATILE